MGSLSWHLAWRYLRRHPSRKGIAFSSVVSVAGVTLGVGALIVVLSVLSGLEGFIRESVLTVDAPLSATPEDGEGFLLESSIIDDLERLPEVAHVSPFIEGEAVVRHPERDLDTGCRVRGVDPGRELEATGLAGKMSYGSPVLIGSDGESRTVMGLYLAEHFSHCVGDTLLFFPPRAFFTSRGFLVGKAVLSGAVETGLPVNDQSIAYLPIDLAREMYLPQGGYSGISIWPADGFSDDRAAAAAAALLPESIHISTWEERNPDLTSSMKLERMGSFLAIMLITLVATFNIIGTISRSAIERRRDISILKAMGAGRRLILKVFLWEGVLVGILGIVLGTVLGLAGCHVLSSTDLLTLPDIYSFHENLPINVSALDTGMVVLVALALSVASAAFPAVRAASLDPVRGLEG